MITRTCACGFVVDGDVKEEANAKMWFHSIHEHPKDLQKMSVGDIEEKLAEMDTEESDEESGADIRRKEEVYE